MKFLPVLFLLTLQSFATGPDPSTNCGAYPPPSQGTYHTTCEISTNICGKLIIKSESEIDSITNLIFSNVSRSTIYLSESNVTLSYNILVKPYKVHLIELNNCESADSLPLPKFDSTFFVLPDSINLNSGDTVDFEEYGTYYFPVYMSETYTISYNTLAPNYSITVNGTTYLPTVISSSPKRKQYSLRPTKHTIRFYNLLGQKRLKAD